MEEVQFIIQKLLGIGVIVNSAMIEENQLVLKTVEYGEAERLKDLRWSFYDLSDELVDLNDLQK